MAIKAPKVQSFFDEPTFTVTYVVWDEASSEAAIIDSLLDYDHHAGTTSKESADQVISFVKQHGLKVKYHIETHVHADHLSAAPYLKTKIGGAIVIGDHITTVQNVFAKIFNTGAEFATDGRQFDLLIRDGDALNLGDISITAIHTPGHTPACMTYVIGDAAFVGDTLFMPDYGTARCDFPGGDARTLYQSIQKILALPEETRIFLCHDYKAPDRDEFVWETNVGAQRAHNIHVHEGITEDEFVSMREARDATLDMPRLILPSVQVNMRAGHMPPPEDNGTSYLKIPINML